MGWVLLASFSTTKEIFSNKLLDSGFHFENYVKAWVNSDVAGIFRNSLVYSIISCSLLIMICAPAAYVLARFVFPGNKVIQTGFVSAMGVPVVMIVLPLFGIVANMGILNHVLSNGILLIFLYIGINIPYTTIFLMTFFSNLSRAFEEAAAIDGCPPTKTFWLIMLPMAQPGIITVTIFNFINIWNEYFISLIFANSDEVHRRLGWNVRRRGYRVSAYFYFVYLPVREDYRGRHRRRGQGLRSITVIPKSRERFRLPGLFSRGARDNQRRKDRGKTGKKLLTRLTMCYIMYNCDVRRKCPIQSPGVGILRYMFSEDH